MGRFMNVLAIGFVGYYHIMYFWMLWAVYQHLREQDNAFHE